jgi:hypothetical protein
VKAERSEEVEAEQKPPNDTKLAKRKHVKVREPLKNLALVSKFHCPDGVHEEGTFSASVVQNRPI